MSEHFPQSQDAREASFAAPPRGPLGLLELQLLICLIPLRGREQQPARGWARCSPRLLNNNHRSVLHPLQHRPPAPGVKPPFRKSPLMLNPLISGFTQALLSYKYLISTFLASQQSSTHNLCTSLAFGPLPSSHRTTRLQRRHGGLLKRADW